MISERSKARLQGVHPDLVRVVMRAAEIGPPFIITEGVRSKERQRELVKKGASRTLNSRHLTGHAVDVADVEATYAPQKMKAIADAFKAAAKDCNVACEHGIDWGWDSPHHQLRWKDYPASAVTVSEKVSEVARVAVSPRVVTGVVAGGAAVAADPETTKVAVETVTQAVPSLPVPAVPPAITESVTNVSIWKSMGETLWSFKTWAIAEPMLSVPLVSVLLAYWLGPWLMSRIRGA